jgi:hypothetical protein
LRKIPPRKSGSSSNVGCERMDAWKDARKRGRSYLIARAIGFREGCGGRRGREEQLN